MTGATPIPLHVWMLDAATLARHFDTLGWKAQPHGAGTFKVVHATDEGEIAVYVRLSENWVIASVVPFLSTRGRNSFELSRWLLRQNRDLLQSKFAYDEDGDVVLVVELPTESLDFVELKSALEGIVRDAVIHRSVLRAASEAK